MEHKTWKRIVPGSETAFLFLHGILGTPAHFKDLIALVPENCSACAPLLPGHGGSTRDFSKSSMAEWKEAAEESVADLARTHKRVYIVAHSMGALFAIRQAVEKPQLVRGLFLLAAPLRLSLKAGMLENMVKLYGGRVAEDDLPAVAARDACSVALTKNIFAYLGWIPRYLELFGEIRAVRKMAGTIQVPTEVFQSAGDELVSSGAAAYFPPAVRCHVLPHSRHYYYDSRDYKALLEAFGSCVERWRQ